MVQVRLDRALEVPYGEVDVGEPVPREPSDDELQDGAIGHRHERLGQHGRIGTQSRPISSRQDHCTLNRHRFRIAIGQLHAGM